MSRARGSGEPMARPVARITANDLRDAALAQLALLRALARVRTRPIGSLVTAGPAAATGHPDTMPGATGAPSPADRAARRILLQRLELALARAARRGLFRPTCLVRSLALADLLGRHGVKGAEIRIGVRQPSAETAAPQATSGALEAHAWVELDGTILGDDPRQARRFTPLGGVRAVVPSADHDRPDQ